jgi:hypothetical protein
MILRPSNTPTPIGLLFGKRIDDIFNDKDSIFNVNQ